MLPIQSKNDKQSRKWQLTINNPQKKDLTHKAIQKLLSELKPIQYYCMSDEVAHTHHTHIYLYCMSPMRFSTLKNKFPTAHIELARGTSAQNRDYVFKEGKWEKDKKHGTNLIDTHEEWGELPLERQGARNDLADLYDMIKQGASDYEILESSPEYFTQIDRMEKFARPSIRMPTGMCSAIWMLPTYGVIQGLGKPAALWSSMVILMYIVLPIMHIPLTCISGNP